MVSVLMSMLPSKDARPGSSRANVVSVDLGSHDTDGAESFTELCFMQNDDGFVPLSAANCVDKGATSLSISGVSAVEARVTVL